MTDTATIFMQLLKEGSPVWRSVTAECINHDAFRVLGPMPDDETWAFVPGSVVTVVPHFFEDGRCGVVAAAISV